MAAVGCWLGEITSILKQAYRDAIHGEGGAGRVKRMLGLR